MPKLDLSAIRSLVTGLELQSGPIENSVDILFTTTLQVIAGQASTPLFNEMARCAVDLLRNDHCRLGMLIPVPELTFTLTSDPINPIPMIMIPFDWATRAVQTPVPEMGRIINVGSQMVDYFNDRYVGQTEQAAVRANAMEAELLLHMNIIDELAVLIPDLYNTTDARQTELLKEFPDGVRTAKCRRLFYTYRPFVPLND